MLTVRQLGSLHGLSRSTLLFYDKIGLLPATVRTAQGYRLYDEKAEKRLAQICRYRAAGLPLEEIRAILEGPRNRISKALEQRLRAINREIAALREQQQSIVRLLRKPEALRDTRVMTKERWVDLLRQCGFSEADMHRWHVTFEAHSPEAHQDFLESLGIDPAQVDSIREYSRTG